MEDPRVHDGDRSSAEPYDPEPIEWGPWEAEAGDIGDDFDWPLLLLDHTPEDDATEVPLDAIMDARVAVARASDAEGELSIGLIVSGAPYPEAGEEVWARQDECIGADWVCYRGRFLPAELLEPDTLYATTVFLWLEYGDYDGFASGVYFTTASGADTGR